MIIFFALLKFSALYHFALYCSFLFRLNFRKFKISSIFHSFSSLTTIENDDFFCWSSKKSSEFFRNKKIWKLLWIFMNFNNSSFTLFFSNVNILKKFNCLSFSFFDDFVVLMFLIDNHVLFFSSIICVCFSVFICVFFLILLWLIEIFLNKWSNFFHIDMNVCRFLFQNFFFSSCFLFRSVQNSFEIEIHN